MHYINNRSSVLWNLKELLLATEPLRPTGGGRFIPTGLTDTAFLFLRILTALFILFHPRTISSVTASDTTTMLASVYVVLHLLIAILRYFRNTSTQNLLKSLGILSDIFFATLLSALRPDLRSATVLIYLIAGSEASLIGPFRYWASFIFIAFATGGYAAICNGGVTYILPSITIGLMMIMIRIYRNVLLQERATFESLTNHIPQMLIRKDLNGKITYANKAFCILNNLEYDQIVGKTDKDLYGDDLSRKYLEEDAAVISTKEPREIKEKHRAFNSQEDIYVEGNKIPILNSSENVIEIQIIFWNVTPRKKWEIRLQSLMETTRDYIYFKDTDSRFLQINNTLSECLGLGSPEDAKDKTDSDFFPEEFAETTRSQELAIISSGTPMPEFEESGSWPDGSPFYISTIKQPLRDTDGGIVGIFGISRDISERKKAEESLRITTQQLRQSQIELQSTNSRLGKDLETASKNAHFGFWYYDLDGSSTSRVKATNGVYPIFDLPPQKEITLKALRSLVHPDDLEHWNKNFAIASTAKPLDPFFIRIKLAGERIKHLHVQTEVEYANDKPTRILGFIQDVTNWKQTEIRAKNLELAIRSFQHMLINACDNAINHLNIGQPHPESHTEPIPIEGLVMDISPVRAATLASDVLFSVKMKAYEVKVFDPEPTGKRFATEILYLIFRRAWSVASELGTLSSDFTINSSDLWTIDKCTGLSIFYEPCVDTYFHVNGALYTVALNIFSNSFRRQGPIVVWVSEVKDPHDNDALQVAFGDSGDYIGDLLSRPDLAPRNPDSTRGVGLPLIRAILQHEAGSGQMLDILEFTSRYSNAPTEILECTSVSVIVIPI
jgi:PAS domain S-box-containing protein